jgi:1-aminocyclopropane-1-carboxylate deaminase
METKMIFDFPTPLVKLDGFSSAHEVYLKRDDLIHPMISGNKWRKLKYNLEFAKSELKTTLITKGGPYSNHIAAVATAGNLYGFQTKGLIRGEEPVIFGSTLRFAQKMGMNFNFIPRNIYPDLKDFYDNIGSEKTYFIPEGGTNELAFQGCGELIKEILEQTDISMTAICLACGTGGTAAGILRSVLSSTEIIGFSALKGNWLKSEIEMLAGRAYPNLRVLDKYCFGGYAKTNDQLIQFINEFYNKYGVPLDPVYTGKMMFGLNDMLQNGALPEGTKVIAIHTGGLQGAFGFQEKGVKLNWLEDPGCEEAIAIKEYML